MHAANNDGNIIVAKEAVDNQIQPRTSTYSLSETSELEIIESFNDWRGRGCHKFVPVVGGDGTKMAPPGDLLDQPLSEMS